jgi:hypothetical protein
MALPGYLAEASLYRTRQVYRTDGWAAPAQLGSVMPQQGGTSCLAACIDMLVTCIADTLVLGPIAPTLCMSAFDVCVFGCIAG